MIGDWELLHSVHDTQRCFTGVGSFESCLNPQDAEIFATPQMRLILSCLQLETSTPFEHPYFHKTLSTVPWVENSDTFEPRLYYEAENKAFEYYRCFETCANPSSSDPQTEAIDTEFSGIPNEWVPIAAVEYTEANNSFNNYTSQLESLDNSNFSQHEKFSNLEYIAGEFYDASIQSLVDGFAQFNSVSTKTPSEMRHLLDRWHLVKYIVLSPSPIIEGWTVVETLQCYRDFKGYTNLHLSQEIESLTGKPSVDKVLIEFFNGVTFENRSR